MKVAIYARVSTKDKGQEVENQLGQLRESKTGSKLTDARLTCAFESPYLCLGGAPTAAFAGNSPTACPWDSRGCTLATRLLAMLSCLAVITCESSFSFADARISPPDAAA